jgi:3-deoxy-manno-octulosonate cytidylyltransferase (CMP-KDO synthetase)
VPHVIGIIPARYQSKRFPGKPLALLGGIPLIVRVLETVQNAKLISEAYVATDDDRIATTVRQHGGQVLMTSNDPPTGSDRVAEAASGLARGELIINIQGDEPFLSGDVIDRVISTFDDPNVVMSTACSLIEDRSHADDPNVVKVVMDKAGNALFFSRSRIPYDRSGEAGAAQLYRHIGIYGFRRDFLMKFRSLERTPLEKSEGLEQLRALEHGYNIRTVIVDGEFPGIDSEEDLFKAEELLGKRRR